MPILVLGILRMSGYLQVSVMVKCPRATHQSVWRHRSYNGYIWDIWNQMEFANSALPVGTGKRGQYIQEDRKGHWWNLSKDASKRP
ncbi:hypothetical protein [Sphingobacterium mizutaii]|uniref:hypothetical protein n=1 Tax=Sphingobacterium mizutaii TaxID=1010 RepID=UPI001625911F|nr:hypothetical protein [Sphingobacterium mizutaii]